MGPFQHRSVKSSGESEFRRHSTTQPKEIPMKFNNRKVNSTTAPTETQRNDFFPWPTSRYFQIHFEELQASLSILHQEMAMQRRALEDLQRFAAQYLKSASVNVDGDDDEISGPRYFRFPGNNN
jgi:hypothetical protein